MMVAPHRNRTGHCTVWVVAAIGTAWACWSGAQQPEAVLVLSGGEQAALRAIADLQEQYLGNFWFMDGFEGGQTTIAARTDWWWQALSLQRLGNPQAAAAYLTAVTRGQLARLVPAGIQDDIQLPVLPLGLGQILAAVRIDRSGFLAGLAPVTGPMARQSVIEGMGYAVRWRNANGGWSPFAICSPRAVTGYGYQPSSASVRVELGLSPLLVELTATVPPAHLEVFLHTTFWNQGREVLETEIFAWVILASRLYRAPIVQSATHGRVLSVRGSQQPALHWVSEATPGAVSTASGDRLEDPGLPALPKGTPCLWKRWRGLLRPAEKYTHRERLSLAEHPASLDAFPEELDIDDPVTLSYATHDGVLQSAPRVYTPDPLLNQFYEQAVLVQALIAGGVSLPPEPVNVRQSGPAQVARNLYEDAVREAFRRPRFGLPPFLDARVQSGRIVLPNLVTCRHFAELSQALPGVAWDEREQQIVIAPEPVDYPPWHPLAGRSWTGAAARNLYTPAASADVLFQDGFARGEVRLSSMQDSFVVKLVGHIRADQEILLKTTTPMRLTVPGQPLSGLGELRVLVQPGQSVLVEAVRVPSADQ